MTNNSVVPRGPEQGLPTPLGPDQRALGDQWQHVLAVDLTILWKRLLCCRQQRRHDINVRNGRVDGLASGNSVGPLHKKRHANTPLKVSDLPTAIRGIHVGEAHITSATVITGEHHNGIVGQALLFQRRHHSAHAAVQRPGHCRVHP